MKDNLEYTVVTFKNAEEIARQIKTEVGYILILKKHPNYTGRFILGASIDLYCKPNIRVEHEKREEVFISTDRDTWKKNRSYLLREIPKPTGDVSWDCARDLFEKIDIGNRYEFKIGVQSCVGQGFYQDFLPLVLYVPSMKCMKPAFKEILRRAITKIESGLRETSLKEFKKSFEFDKEDIKKILGYVMQDLEDSKVLMKNIAAGQEADMMVGF